jgi:hypothetical protein
MYHHHILSHLIYTVYVLVVFCFQTIVDAIWVVRDGHTALLCTSTFGCLSPAVLCLSEYERRHIFVRVRSASYLAFCV